MTNDELIGINSLENLSQDEKSRLLKSGYRSACADSGWFHTWHVGNFTKLWTVEIAFVQGQSGTEEQADDRFVLDTGVLVSTINQPPQSGWRTLDVPQKCRASSIRWVARLVGESGEFDDEDEWVAPRGEFYTEAGVAWEDGDGLGGSGMNKPLRRSLVMRPVGLSST